MACAYKRSLGSAARVEAERMGWGACLGCTYWRPKTCRRMRMRSVKLPKEERNYQGIAAAFASARPREREHTPMLSPMLSGSAPLSPTHPPSEQPFCPCVDLRVQVISCRGGGTSQFAQKGADVSDNPLAAGRCTARSESRVKARANSLRSIALRTSVRVRRVTLKSDVHVCR
jgi:hypothetical protein